MKIDQALYTGSRAKSNFTRKPSEEEQLRQPEQ
jgi:hypothetical protein